MNKLTIPSSLLSHKEPTATSDSAITSKTLLDLMYDGFYALFLLKNNNQPFHDQSLSETISKFLDEFDRHAKKYGANAEDIYDAKYAFCASVDELILRSHFNIREHWERRPLQLAIFGDQLAGEHFFEKLETLRAGGKPRLQVLEVFHMCLLLGFEGKYMLDEKEKLNYLTARVGDEIALMRGKSGAFSPRWSRPDNIQHKLHYDVPLWAIFAIFMLISLIGYLSFYHYLSDHALTRMNVYNDVIQMAPKSASIYITLP